jgi:hypothetical protein
VPFERGVYYQAPSGLYALESNLFMPLQNSGAKELLWYGSPALRTILPGTHSAAAIQEPRPTFYLRGYRPGNRIYLVRASQKQDHRELRMTRSRDIAGWAEFRNEDLAEVEVEMLADDLARLVPRTPLSAGEYVFITVLEPRFRAIRLAFDFTVLSSTASAR